MGDPFFYKLGLLKFVFFAIAEVVHVLVKVPPRHDEVVVRLAVLRFVFFAKFNFSLDNFIFVFLGHKLFVFVFDENRTDCRVADKLKLGFHFPFDDTRVRFACSY